MKKFWILLVIVLGLNVCAFAAARGTEDRVDIAHKQAKDTTDVFSKSEQKVFTERVSVVAQRLNKGVRDVEVNEPEVPEVIETEPVTTELTICAVGDNLIHSPLYKKAKQEDGSYDFTPMYENIKDTIQTYDIAVINQETPIVASEANYSGYPCFGTPEACGDAVIDCGFDVVLGASNHSWDKGETGWSDSLAYWGSHPEIIFLGSHSSEEDWNTIDIVEQNGFKLAMFNYTYGLNGFRLPDDKPWAIDLLDNADKLYSDIENVEDEVDFTVCFIHVGEEYVYKPTAYAQEVVDNCIDHGADIVICAHPHVVEPVEERVTENGNTGLVYWSLGNFVSGQTEVPRVLGGLADITLYKTEDETGVIDIGIKDYSFIPLVTQQDAQGYRVYKLEDYTDELAQAHKLGVTVGKLWDLWYYITDPNYVKEN